MSKFTFAEFASANERRQTEFGHEHTLEELGLCVAEEAGEVCAALLGAIGAKRRKAHLTSVDVCNEIADLVTYCELLCRKMGYSFGNVVRDGFNRVSKRSGSTVTL